MLLQRLATLAVAMEAMVAMVMEDMGATVMERDLLKLMPSQDTTEEDMEVMVDMAVDTVMERGRLMPSQDTAVDMDMAVMVVMAMEDMVIAVKFFPLFIVPPPLIFYWFKDKKHE